MVRELLAEGKSDRADVLVEAAREAIR